ncbi:MAG: hypothetical protein NT029_07760 [Armatimonadetes bacterium]|nr:hypothetical protein [Armatimonadota bacterium]
MPVDTLFVEGKLDVEILTALCAGAPEVERAGGKGELSAAVTDALQLGRNAAYLRDRDFDYKPGDRANEPAVDHQTQHKVVLGWRWFRHSLECYLLEPSLVALAVPTAATDFVMALRAAAAAIRWYQAARWAVATARHATVPWYKLETGIDSHTDFRLPERLDHDAVAAWMDGHVAQYRDHWNRALEPDEVRRQYGGYAQRFDAGFLGDTAAILVWFSGKDLMAALGGWAATAGMDSPGKLRERLRDWVLTNPERALELLPEWSRLCEKLRAPAPHR